MKKYFPALDGVRAIAIAIVLAAHAGLSFPKHGMLGVDIFFVLSGFLITSILSDEFQQSGRISRKNFYARRFLRLSPCLLLTCVVFAVLYAIQYRYLPKAIVLISITYTSNWARALFHYRLYSMQHCWSLAIEEQYYLLWPFVVIGLEKWIKHNQTRFLSLLALALLLAAYRAALVGTYDADRIAFGLDTHMDGLVMGSSLCYLVASLRQSDQKHLTAFKVLSRLIVPAAMVCLLGLMYWVAWRSPWMGRLGFFLAAVSTSAVILDLIVSPFSLIKGALASPPLVYVGRISYGLYLLHYPIFFFIADYVSQDLSRPFKIALAASISFAAAALSFHLIESRFLRLKKYFQNNGASGQEPNQSAPATAMSAAPDL